MEESSTAVLEEKAARKEAARRAKKRKKRIKLIITLVIVLAVVGGIVFGLFKLFHKKEVKQTVWSDVVTRGNIQSTVTGSGVTRAKDAATLTLTSGGKVEEVFVAAGDTVQKGDPLYTVDSTEAQKAVEDAQKTVDDYQKQINALNESYADLTLAAPFSGKLLDALSADVGDDMASGTKVGTLVDDKTMKLSLYFSYAYESNFTVGKAATISIPSTMNTLAGKVEKINKVHRVSAEGSELFEVVFSVVNPGTLTADMGATAYLSGADGETVYPYEAGKLAYNRSVDLVTKAGGELSAVNLTDYADIAAGQVLVQMKPDDNDNQLASLATSMKSAQDTLKKEQEALSNYNAVAPIAGTVIACNLTPGETAEAGRAAVTIADTSVMLIDAQIDEMDVSYLQVGMPCDITQEGTDGSASFMGTIQSVSMEGKYENGVSYFPAVIQVDNPEGAILSGMYVDYSIMASQSDNCLTVPVQAVKYTEAGTCLFIKADSAPDNALDATTLGMEVPEGFYAVPVTVGLSDDTSAEITEGAEEGAEVFIQYVTDQGDSWSQSSGMAVAVG